MSRLRSLPADAIVIYLKRDDGAIEIHPPEPGEPPTEALSRHVRDTRAVAVWIDHLRRRAVYETPDS